MDLRTAVALSLLPGLARFTVVAALRDRLPRQESRSETGARPDVRSALVEAGLLAPMERTLGAADLALERAAAAGVTAVTWWDTRYPDLLASVDRAPAVLWVRGRVDVLTAPAVAVVGTRAASAGATRVAHELARDVAAAGLVVVSGLARGIDVAAHEGAMDGGVTVAVLGCGVDVAYPAEHRALAERIAGRGALVSEFPPATAPRRHHFPLRNRILSGLSRATVVVEAPERSGALITARLALDQGRDVLVVPGSVAGARNAGGHKLIRDGARLVQSASEVLEDLGWSPAACVARAAAPIDDPVLAAVVAGDLQPFDEIVERSGLDARAVLARLATLEIAGLVARAAGGWFVRSGRKW